jgi:transcription elongation factor GreA
MTRLITREGLKKIQDELELRRTVKRQEIARAIKEAKEQGDLSENAEYAEAKHQQNENENRVAELEAIVKDSEVVEHDKSVIGIQMGSIVRVKFNGSEMEFQIVGSNEADPANFKISNESPMGNAFMGRIKDDIVEAVTPAGKKRYKILDVK